MMAGLRAGVLRHRFIIGQLLMLATVLLSVAMCSTERRHDNNGDISSTPSRNAGARHSSIRRWIERLVPRRLHGSVGVGPGFMADFDTDFGMNLDSTAKWWLGQNVCVRSDEVTDPTRRGEHDDVSDDNEGHDRRHVTRGGRRERNGGRRATHRVSFTHTCVDLASPHHQYRCTTVKVLGQQTTTTTTVYECCHGYTRAPGTSDGCNIEIQPDLTASLQAHGVEEMSRALNVTGLAQVLNRDSETDGGQYTVFAPSDAAINNYLPTDNVRLNVVQLRRNSRGENLGDQLDDIIANHVVEGLVLSADIVDNLKLRSAEQPKKQLRLNKYQSVWLGPKPMMTVNCVPLVSVDIRARNGVVHVVDKVLPSVENNIDQLVSKHPRLTIISSLVERLMLDSTDGHYTLLAPSDEAFSRLDPALLQRLQETGDQCAINLLRQHILPRIICSSALLPYATRLHGDASLSVSLRNVDRRNIVVTFRDNGSQNASVMYANGAQVVETDLMATNGVVHIIDDVMFSETGVGLLDLAKSPEMNTNLFIELIERVGLKQRIEMMQSGYTLFIPTNAAIEEMQNSMDPMDVEQLIENHLVPGAVLTRARLHDDIKLTSMNNGSLLIQDYSNFLSRRSLKTVQCAVIIASDVSSNRVCDNGIGHVINSVLPRPAASVLELLSRDPQFSQLIELLELTELTHILDNPTISLTVFAPNNTALDNFAADTMRQLRGDVNKLQRVLLSHIIPDILCCSGVFSSNLFDRELNLMRLNMDRWMLHITRSPTLRNTVTVEQVAVSKCDLAANNGLVHVIDQFLPSAIERHMTSSHGVNRWFSSSTDRIIESIQELLGMA